MFISLFLCFIVYCILGVAAIYEPEKHCFCCHLLLEMSRNDVVVSQCTFSSFLLFNCEVNSFSLITITELIEVVFDSNEA